MSVPGEQPIVLDLGTGLRPLGDALLAGGDPLPGGSPGGVGAPASSPARAQGLPGASGARRVTALLSHLHWDHILGLPFFTPLEDEAFCMDVYGPGQPEGTLEDAFHQVIHPPFFPVHLAEMRGNVRFSAVEAGDHLAVGSAKVRVASVPHIGATLGFRIEADGGSVAYVCDHQAPSGSRPGADGPIAASVLELCDGADLVIHDAQYTDEEFAAKHDWGHSTVGYAVRVAAEAGARRLALFHHDPTHVDDDVDRLLSVARDGAAASRLDDVLAAAEGSTVVVGRQATTEEDRRP